MSSSFTVAGIDSVKSALIKTQLDTIRETKAALHDEATDILSTAQSNVPVDSGELRDSGVVIDVPDDNDLSVSIQFGGGSSAPYALAVHENPSEHDPPSWKGKSVQFTVGGSKYLERPLNEAVNGLADRIAEKIAARDSG